MNKLPLTELWPEETLPLPQQKFTELLNLLQPLFTGQLSLNRLPTELSAELPRLYLPLAAWLSQKRPPKGPLLVGINGSQGSGKSTLCKLLKWLLEAAFDCRTCVISIDDLYLPKAARQTLAKTIHPLLATRGVPGTHDIDLARELFAKLKNNPAGSSIEIPRFNKATDDRLPRQEWDQLVEPADIILFEGWCVGATPQTEQELVTPVNQLEVKEDPAGDWRNYVNQQLSGPYQQMFSEIDLLLMLKIPGWEMVYHWRKRQEEQLAAQRSGSGVMSETALRRFIMHYERLTRHQLQSLPACADLTCELNQQQRVTTLRLA